MADETWWRDGVLYQIYPRSFADSDGDGVGDLAGIASRLDHLAWLGVDGIWLNPDDALAERRLGLRRERLHRRASRSRDARGPRRARGRGRRARDPRPARPRPQPHERSPPLVPGRAHRPRRPPSRLVRLGRPAPGGGPPNNWESNFGGSAWELHEPTGQWFLKNFLPTQPDLNWWNEEVRTAFDDVLRFWFERGIAGFRIDVCHAIVKDRELRDDPAVTEDDHPEVRRRGRPAGVLDEPARGPRRAAPLARARRRGGPAARARGGDVRARARPADPVLRHRRGRAEPGLQLPLRARRARRGPAAHDRRGGGGEAARRRVAGLHRLQPRRRPAGHALGGGRPAARPRGAADADDAARHAVPLLRRRARAARGRDRLAHRARPRRAAHRGPVAQPRPLPHADAVDGRAGRRVHRGRRRAVAPVRRPRVQRRGPARGPRLDAPPGARPDRAAARRGRPAHGRVRDAAGAGRRVGVAARRRLRRRGQPVGRARRGRRRGGPHRDRAPTARATARSWTGRSRSARGRRRWCRR